MKKGWIILGLVLVVIIVGILLIKPQEKSETAQENAGVIMLETDTDKTNDILTLREKNCSMKEECALLIWKQGKAPASYTDLSEQNMDDLLYFGQTILSPEKRVYSKWNCAVWENKSTNCIEIDFIKNQLGLSL